MHWHKQLIYAVLCGDLREHDVENSSTMFTRSNRIAVLISSSVLFSFTILQFSQSNISYENDSSFTSVFQEEPAEIRRTIREDLNQNIVTIDRDLFEEMAFHLRDAPYDGVGNYTRFMTALLGLKELTNVEPLVPGTGPVINDVSSFEYPFAIAPCREKLTNHRSLFIAVISAPRNFERRATIRRTWPNHLKNQTNSNKPLDIVGFSFVVGLTKDDVIHQKLMEENETYRDMLQVNMHDKYRNLSLKVTGLLNWVHHYCPQVDFVLKVDDDVYVNVHNLATVLHSHPPSERSVYGRKCGGDTISERIPRNDSIHIDYSKTIIDFISCLTFFSVIIQANGYLLTKVGHGATFRNITKELEL